MTLVKTLGDGGLHRVARAVAAVKSKLVGDAIRVDHQLDPNTIELEISQNGLEAEPLHLRRNEGGWVIDLGFDALLLNTAGLERVAIERG